MKKNSLLTLLVAVCLAACTGEKVLERPAFKSATSPDIFPMKVELTKEATIVHFHMNCAAWRTWDMTGARLEADGLTFAYQQGRIITHEGQEV